MSARRRPLVDELRRVRGDLEDPESAIASGLVRVDGVVVHNPRSMVRPGCAIVVVPETALRGSAKLRAALDTFGIDVRDRIALDVGAAAGGFTAVLLERGARRVFAVDAGHGQLIGSLRQSPLVVNLEATNVGELTTSLVPDGIDLVTVDVSYLSLGTAVAHLDQLDFAGGADLVGLVKPMFELRMASAPTDRVALDRAVAAAVSDVQRCGWVVVRTMPSPVRGAKGAVEGWVQAVRRESTDAAAKRSRRRRTGARAGG